MTTAAAIITDNGLPQGRRRLKCYSETSDSAIPFVQRLPSHWRVERLKYVASVRFSVAVNSLRSITQLDNGCANPIQDGRGGGMDSQRRSTVRERLERQDFVEDRRC
jgi:hypothetical protein